MDNFYTLKLEDIIYNLNTNNKTLTIITYNRKNCKSSNIEIPDTFIIDGVSYIVTTIGENAFSEKYDFLTGIILPNTLKIIKENAFYNCEKLFFIRLSNTLQEIQSHAFFNCNNLETIDFPDSLLVIGNSAFQFCKKLTLASPYLPKNLKTLGDAAFANTGILEIICPNSLIVINEYVFFECDNLKKVVLGKNVVEIKRHAFSNCKKLETISFSNVLKEIGDSAFSNCFSLKEKFLPDSLLKIQAYAFHYCDSLNITMLPKSLNFIGNNAFLKISSLKKIIIQNENLKIETNAFPEDCIFILNNSFSFENYI